MAQQFEQPLEGETLRAQRMTSDESRAVIDLWQQEQADLTGLTDKPAVPDVAEGLDITVEDVQRLLSEVRAKRLEEERELASEQELSEIRLAEEERQLAEIRRQRAELRRERAEAKRLVSDHWRRQEISPRLRRGKPRQSAPVEWTGNEDFWQDTEEDKEFREAYRAERIKRAFRYALYAVASIFLVPLLLMLLLGVFGILGTLSRQ